MLLHQPPDPSTTTDPEAEVGGASSAPDPRFQTSQDGMAKRRRSRHPTLTDEEFVEMLRRRKGRDHADWLARLAESRANRLRPRR